MAITNQVKNQHLLWRAGFGPMAEQLQDLAVHSQQSFLKALIHSSRKAPEYIDVADTALKGLLMGVGEVAKMERKEADKERKKQLRKQSREDIKSLNLTWLNEMVNSEQQLREKMSLFWHGHFASRNLNILYEQQLLHSIRSNALGNFGTLLREVSKSAAMLNFLNNNQNRKNHPNENFAREVMELFTMGRGHYTEKDVKEAARAFTGWGANIPGEFVFRRFQHDNGTKTFLGRTGNFDGDDVLDILLEQPATSEFITQKVYKYFVNEEADNKKINWLASRFRQSNYDIAALMTDIFGGDWFYDEKNIGTKIKSPVELLVGMQRMLPMEIDNPEIQLQLQRLLGQLLFYPPNVAGWPGGKNWIDSSSLMLRLRIPEMATSEERLNMNPKDDDDQMMGMKDTQVKRQNKQMFQCRINWEEYQKQFTSIDPSQLQARISSYLIQKPGTISGNIINRFIDKSSRNNYIRSLTIRLMSTPEYQLC